MNEIATTGEGEYVEKKSRFIGYICKVSSAEEAQGLIDNKKKQYYDARHNCSAYRLLDAEGKVVSRFSDDGEPSGTAGKPILEVLEGADLINVVCVVTRYFGGVLLGTGGLVRAYTAATKAAIDAAGILLRQQGLLFTLETDYNDLGKVEYFLREQEIPVLDTAYEAKVTITGIALPEKKGQLQSRIADLSKGTGAVVFGEETGFTVEGGKVRLL